MSILHNLIHQFNEISIKIPGSYFVDADKLIQHLNEEIKDPE